MIKCCNFHVTTLRNSHQRSSMKKGVLKNFAKFTGKHLCRSLFFNKVTGLSPAAMLIKETLVQVFSCEFCKISENTFLQNTSGRLLLNFFMTKISYLYEIKKKDKPSKNMLHENHSSIAKFKIIKRFKRIKKSEINSPR